jgi:hypothetical protein
MVHEVAADLVRGEQETRVLDPARREDEGARAHAHLAPPARARERGRDGAPRAGLESQDGRVEPEVEARSLEHGALVAAEVLRLGQCQEHLLLEPLPARRELGARAQRAEALGSEEGERREAKALGGLAVELEQLGVGDRPGRAAEVGPLGDVDRVERAREPGPSGRGPAEHALPRVGLDGEALGDDAPQPVAVTRRALLPALEHADREARIGELARERQARRARAHDAEVVRRELGAVGRVEVGDHAAQRRC